MRPGDASQAGHAPDAPSRQASAEEDIRRIRDEIAVLKGSGAADKRLKAKISSLEAQLQRKAQKVALYREIESRRERFDRPVGLLEGDLSDSGEALAEVARGSADDSADDIAGQGAIGRRGALEPVPEQAREFPRRSGESGKPQVERHSALEAESGTEVLSAPAAQGKAEAPGGSPISIISESSEASVLSISESSREVPVSDLPSLQRGRHASDIDPEVYFSRIRGALLRGTGVYSQREVQSLLARPRDFLTHFKMPAVLYSKLRGYQQEGLKWLLSLYHLGRCGLLADEPGLGKTVQTVSFLLSLFLTGATRTALLVSPATLMRQWATEISDWAPFVRTVTLTSSTITEEASRGMGTGAGLRASELARGYSRGEARGGSFRSVSGRVGGGGRGSATAGMRYAAAFDSLVTRQAEFYRVFEPLARDALAGLPAAVGQVRSARSTGATGAAGPGGALQSASPLGEPLSRVSDVSRVSSISGNLGASRAQNPSSSTLLDHLVASLRQHAGTVYICSYEFASANSARLGAFFEALEELRPPGAPWGPKAPNMQTGENALQGRRFPLTRDQKTIPCAVFDEIHYLKNAASNRSKSLRSLPAAFKLGLSGTPIQNDFSELYALLNFLSPGLLGDPDDFKRRFDWPIKTGSYAEASVESIRRAISLSSELYGIIRPYLLRRLKVHVEKELPSKTEYLVWCKLGSEQERIYRNFLDTDDGVQQIRKLEASGQKIRLMEKKAAKRYSNIRMTKLVELQQICDHPLLPRVNRLSADRAIARQVGASGIRGRRHARPGKASKPSKVAERRCITHSAGHLGGGAGRGAERHGRQKHSLMLREGGGSVDSDVSSSSALVSDLDSNSSFDSDLASSSFSSFSGEFSSLSEEDIQFPRFHVGADGEAGQASAAGAARASETWRGSPAAAIDFTMSSKLMWLRAALRNSLKTAGNLRPGEKALIFCQGQKMLGLVQSLLVAERIGFVRMDGSTPMEARGELVERFSTSPSCVVFLLTTRVGGLGLNLVAARKVYVVNPSWNPAVDDQAMDRCWRIKQTGAVEVYRLLTAGTVEERMYNRQVYKKAMSNKLLENVLGARGTMSRSDLYNLFQYKPPKENVVVELVHVFNGKDQTGNIVLDNLPEGLRKRLSVRRTAPRRGKGEVPQGPLGDGAGGESAAPRAQLAATAPTAATTSVAPAAPAVSTGPAAPPAAPGVAPTAPLALPTPSALGYITFADLADGEERLAAYLAEEMPELCGDPGEGEGDATVDEDVQDQDQPVALFDIVGEKLDKPGEALRVAKRILEFLAESKANDVSMGAFDAFFDERVRESFLAREELEEVRDTLVMRDAGRGLCYARRGIRKALLG